MPGCLVGLFIENATASSSDHWYLFYTFPIDIGVANLVQIAGAFCDALLVKRKQSNTGSIEQG